MRVGLFALLLALTHPAIAATTLMLQVSDLHDRPLANVIVSAKANSATSAPTDIAGKTRIELSEDIQPGQTVGLILVKAPFKDLRFFSPWEGFAIVPMANQAITIVLGVLGDKAALMNPNVVSTMAEKIASETRTIGELYKDAAGRTGSRPSASKIALKAVSGQYDLDPVEVDQAIRALSKGTGSFTGVPSNQMKSAKRYVLAASEYGGKA